jgi:hypothetical protein
MEIPKQPWILYIVVFEIPIWEPLFSN